ncbi:phosphoribosyltransferase family protein [Cytobacillus horneckiae]|uniref:phosphoribosyltransferase family protein n=1 Tax=Cytobacillus horneckiae TaxID=549687 RepID=UPI003D1ADDED
MMNTQTSTYYNQLYTLDILNQMKVHIQINENPYGIDPARLFKMAARINKKRSFLFVSNVLGKHVPIQPQKGLAIGLILASRYMEAVHNKDTDRKELFIQSLLKDNVKLKDSPFIDEEVHPVIIGFAETATALGHSFYQSFHHADFFHTTRENIKGLPSIINFEEEHSHATSHRSYVNEKLLNNQREIILVDDEITTGKTAINIIRSLHDKYPRQSYTVVSILDWRTMEHKHQFTSLEKELDITINNVSLLSGTIKVDGEPPVKNHHSSCNEPATSQLIEEIFIESEFPHLLSNVKYSSESLRGQENNIPYLYETGRFGLHSSENQMIHEKLTEIAATLKGRRNGGKTLCLGTGEFMYVPMKLAAMMGDDVYYQSTTRSPIYIEDKAGYGARFGLSYPNPEDEEISHFVYNIPPDEYEDIFIFFERFISKRSLSPLLEELAHTFIGKINLVYFTGGPAQ